MKFTFVKLKKKNVYNYLLKNDLFLLFIIIIMLFFIVGVLGSPSHPCRSVPSMAPSSRPSLFLPSSRWIHLIPRPQNPTIIYRNEPSSNA